MPVYTQGGREELKDSAVCQHRCSGTVGSALERNKESTGTEVRTREDEMV